MSDERAHAIEAHAENPATAEADARRATAMALRRLGLSLWSDGRLAEAIGVFHEAASREPDDARILAELGTLLTATGRDAEAAEFLARSLKSDPSPAVVWISYANALRACADPLAAEAALRRALKIDPDNLNARIGLGLLLFEVRQFREAAYHLEAAIHAGANDHTVFACLGETSYLIGNFADAACAFAEAIERAPQIARYHQRHARARLIETAMTQPATEAFDAWREAAGDAPEEIERVGQDAFHLLAAFGHDAAAMRMGEHMLSRAPDDPILLHHMDALKNRALARVPDDYLVTYFDRYAATFDRHVVDVLRYSVPDVAGALLGRHGRRVGRALDLGCGTGLFAPTLAKFSTHLTGVDISGAMLDVARGRELYHRLDRAEALDWLDANDDCFDLVVALDLLIYFGDLDAFFDRLSKKLNSGGLALFSYETGETDRRLLSSGRFAHSPEYVSRLCCDRFEFVDVVETAIRYEANAPVAGHVVAARRR
jgi:predicted TPR repeat methyltransferase